MVSVIVETPYQFVPPHRGNWWPSFIQWFKLYEGHLRKIDGVVGYEIRNAQRLKASLQAGHGIMMTPNHSRYADPLVLGWLAKNVGTHVFAMASWHLFNRGGFSAFSIQKMGGFSVFREGVDKQSIETAINAVVDAKRPLILFAEGATFRANDILEPLLDGASFVARTAARRRDKHGGKVVIHPVAIKYLFEGDIRQWADTALAKIEHHFTWETGIDLPLIERITRAAAGVLTLKEMQHLRAPQTGSFSERQTSLTQALLDQVESRWDEESNNPNARSPAGGNVLNRVKSLRSRMFPDLLSPQTAEADKERIRRDLRKLELAQQLASFPVGYLDQKPLSVTRVLEAIENIEEALFETTSWPGPLKAIVDVGEAIEVPPQRAARNGNDPLLDQISVELQAMLDQLATEARTIET